MGGRAKRKPKLRKAPQGQIEILPLPSAAYIRGGEAPPNELGPFGARVVMVGECGPFGARIVAPSGPVDG
jgi:hypothetical protein